MRSALIRYFIVPFAQLLLKACNKGYMRSDSRVGGALFRMHALLSQILGAESSAMIFAIHADQADSERVENSRRSLEVVAEMLLRRGVHCIVRAKTLKNEEANTYRYTSASYPTGLSSGPAEVQIFELHVPYADARRATLQLSEVLKELGMDGDEEPS